MRILTGIGNPHCEIYSVTCLRTWCKAIRRDVGVRRDSSCLTWFLCIGTGKYLTALSLKQPISKYYLQTRQSAVRWTHCLTAVQLPAESSFRRDTAGGIPAPSRIFPSAISRLISCPDFDARIRLALYIRTTNQRWTTSKSVYVDSPAPKSPPCARSARSSIFQARVFARAPFPCPWSSILHRLAIPYRSSVSSMSHDWRYCKAKLEISVSIVLQNNNVAMLMYLAYKTKTSV